MATVVAEMTMSLDGFIADPQDGVGELFGWYENGDVVVPNATPGLTFSVTPASAKLLQETIDDVGALVTGRRLFDHTDGWSGRHPFDVPVFVISHTVPEGWAERFPDAPFTFVTDGIESAVAQARAAADDGLVCVAGAATAQSCLNAGLVDELRVHLVPVLMGEGIPFFANLARAPIRLSDPVVVEGRAVTHLRYEVAADNKVAAET